jgi:hypothetical protein
MKSPYKKWNPFLDDHGILRVGGRLERADITNILLCFQESTP